MATRTLPIRFKTGTATQVDAATPALAEPVWVTDTKKVRVGDGSTVGGIEISGDSFKTITVTDSDPTGSFSETGNAVASGADTLTLWGDAGVDIDVDTTNNYIRFQVSGAGTMDSWNIQGDTGGPDAIGDAETLDIAGGSGIDTAYATNTVTVNLNITELTAATTLEGADSFALYDSGATANSEATITQLQTYMQSNLTFNDYNFNVDTDTNGATAVADNATLSIDGGTGITTSHTGTTVSVAHDSHTGDVTGSTALTIGNDKVLTAHILNSNVTFAKIQNIATARFLGRTTASSGVIEELTLAQIHDMGVITTAGGQTIAGALTVSGDLTVSGTTTTIDTATLVVEDKNIELGNVTTPTDITADGGGITLLGGTNKTILWTDATDSWDFNQEVRTTHGFGINNVGTPSDANLDGLGITFFGSTNKTITWDDTLDSLDSNTQLSINGNDVLTTASTINGDAIAVTEEDTAASRYMTFVGGTSGDQTVYVDDQLTFNPSTNVMTIATNAVVVEGDVISGGSY